MRRHQVLKENPTTVGAPDVIVSGGPPIWHGDSGGGSHKSSHERTITIVSAVLGVLSAVAVVAVLGVWLARLKSRQKRNTRSDCEIEQLLMNEESIDTATATPSVTGVDSRGLDIPQQKRLKCAAADRDAAEPATIEAMAGGIVIDTCGTFALIVPQHASHTSGTIKISSCHLEDGDVFSLPRGVIPRSHPVRLLPDHFEYEQPVRLMVRLADNVCLPEDCQLSLWHNTNTDNPHYTELTDSVCRPLCLPNGHRYVACWLKRHCDVMLCQRVPDDRWKLIGEIYAEVSRGVIRNLHMFLADNSDTVKVGGY